MKSQKINPDLEMHLLQNVLEQAPIYHVRISGKPASSLAAQETLHALPEGMSYDDKYVLGIYWNDLLIGCADILRGYPNQSTAMIGLLLLSESYQGKGLGKMAYQQIEDFIFTWQEITTLRISIMKSNDSVTSFWSKMGFQDSGIRKKIESNGILDESMIFEKK